MKKSEALRCGDRIEIPRSVIGLGGLSQLFSAAAGQFEDSKCFLSRVNGRGYSLVCLCVHVYVS